MATQLLTAEATRLQTSLTVPPFLHLSILLLFLPLFSCHFVNSKLPYDVTPEQAMSHEEVRTRLEASIKNMKTITDKFLSAIIVSVDKIP